jgi:hypothetical protein
VQGAWWPGAVLGWRHDEAGGCEAEVRVLLEGVAQVRWVELGSVRLPEAPAAPTPAVPVVRAGSSVPSPAETVVMSRSELRGLLSSGLPAVPAGRRRRHAADLTAEFPAVRCAGPEAGRHRAPTRTPARVTAAPGGGRHRAGDDTGSVTAVPGPRAGGSASERWTRPIRMEDVAGWPWEPSASTA